MLDHDDLKWIASTSTDLNSLLQQISRYADLARRHKEQPDYLDLLAERVELATKASQELFDRVTSKILAKTVAQSSEMAENTPPAFSVVPPPTAPAVPHEQKPQSNGSKRLSEAKAPTRSSAPDLSTELEVKNPRGNREYILLVEDETQVAEVAAEMLAEEGYKVIVAHDGFEALKIYRNVGKQIGLVILDYFLPVMDGDAVFEELRALNSHVNVVLSSGFAEQQKISAMLAQGLRGFIPKPYSSEKLLGQVRSTLDAARQRLA
ncbi:MAG TPA: response regulator [Chthoniobacterales bacterium]|nr:response regulator [Chthoniobacterales bacterium]